MIQPGRYRHYKGLDYDVLGTAKHSETEEEFVVYRALYGKQGLWIRRRQCSRRWCRWEKNGSRAFSA